MHHEFIQKLTHLVEANLANEKFGPEELAKEAGMSHSNLHRKLKTISNQSASQFIREVRLKKAKELLLNEEDSTSAEIAYRVGFGSATYFSKCFHEYFGYSPGEMRNHEQEEEPEKQVVEAIPKKRNRTRILIGIAVILVVLIPSTYLLIKSILKENIKDKSIAVLPFKYLGEETAKQYLADGMMDAITTKLSKIKDLRVISETSVEQYRNTIKTAKTIGKEQNVAYLLEGSFQKENNEVRLILQLIKTKNENHEWSNIYDRQWKDIFSVQSEVAETVASELHAIITPEERQRIRKTPTTNLTAYDYYIRGKDELEQYDLSNNADTMALNKAQNHFKKALELDSTFALAYTGLAGCYSNKSYWKTYLSESFMDSVLNLTNRALAYDPQCSEAYGYRATRYRDLGQLEKALKEVEKANKYDPNDWRAYSFRGNVLSELFDYVGAIKYRNEAILRNHGSKLPNSLEYLSYMYLEIGFPEIAKKYFQQVLELDGDSLRYLTSMALTEFSCWNFEKAYQIAKSVFKKDSTRIGNLSMYCTMAGYYDEAYFFDKKNYETTKKSGEVNLWASKEIGGNLWQTGRKKEAEFYFNQQIKICEESIMLGRLDAFLKGFHFALAEVYACKGDKEKAYYYLDEAKKSQYWPIWRIIFFKHSPLLEPIRHEPRFQEILKDVEAKYQAEHERVRKWLVEQKML